MHKDNSIVYAFIDSQNLHLGVGNDIVDKRSGKVIYRGWRLDFKKFRLYLKNKYNVSKAYLFIGHVPGNESLYSFLQEAGYILVFKPTMPFENNGIKDTKGNVDAELVLYASALLYDKYDQSIIVSGDGDFLCLVEYLDDRNKLLCLMAPNRNYSGLLNKYANRIVRVDTLQNRLAYMPSQKIKKTGLAGRSKP
jgi:uncharacterized LabA/DUF88 family protein